MPPAFNLFHKNGPWQLFWLQTDRVFDPADRDKLCVGGS